MKAVSRRSALCLIGASALLGSSCMTTPRPRTNADGSYCHAIGRSHRRTLTCTDAPIPSEQAEAAAKQFEATSGLLTVYVIRAHWADPINVVRLTADAGSPIATVPSSLVRLRLKPGHHKLTADWSEGRTSFDLDGAAGEILFIELVGSVWIWHTGYSLEWSHLAKARDKSAGLRLVADVQ